MIQLSVELEELKTFDFDRQLDIIVDAFESSWRTGKSPVISEFVKLVEPRFQKRLLRELILVERECFHYFDDGSASKIKSDVGTVTTSRIETVDADSGVNDAKTCETPTHFDRFAIIKLLGRGSHWTVYEAEDLEIRRRVALKIAYSIHGDSEVSRAFASEAANASRVNHPSIVRVLEVGEFRGKHFMVSELIEGVSLSEYAVAKKLDDLECVQIVADIAAGVEVAHRSGVIHRDLKPSNIMIQFLESEIRDIHAKDSAPDEPTEYRVRILDFGIAKMLDRLTRRTLAGDIVGTPHYMSPEQASGNSAQVDQRSDIFSLGVILYELLCGRLPFDGSELTVVTGIRDLNVPSISAIRPSIPRALEQVVHQCLEKNPTNRYQSAAALESDLRKWMVGKKPGALIHYERAQIAWYSALAASLCLLLGVGFALSRSGWLNSIIRIQPLVGDSPVSADASNAIKLPIVHLTTWLEQGQPQSFVDWIESEGDPDTRRNELNALMLENSEEASRNWRLRFAELCVQSEGGSDPETLDEIADSFVMSLEPSQESAWSNAVAWAPTAFVRELESRVHGEPEQDQSQNQSQKLSQNQSQTLSHIVVTRLAKDRALDRLFAFLKNARAEELKDVIAAIEKCEAPSGGLIHSLVHREFDQTEPKTSQELYLGEIAPWRAKLALVAYLQNDWDIVDRVLSFSVDPRSRSYFVYWFKICDFSIEPLLSRFAEFKDDTRPNAVLDCLSNIPRQNLSAKTTAYCESLLKNAFLHHPSFGVHRASRRLLVAWGMESFVRSQESSDDFRELKDNRDWYVSDCGTRMNIVRIPREFWFGNPKTDSDPGVRRRLERSFAVAETMVSESQFAKFDPTKYPNDSNKPATGLSWTEAVEFLDWKNRTEGHEDRDSISIAGDGARYSESIGGYRLISASEWECYFREGTQTESCYGDSETDFRFKENAVSPDPPEWTSTPSELQFEDARNYSFAQKEWVVTKGGFFPNTPKPVPMFYFKISTRENKRSYGIRLCRSIE